MELKDILKEYKNKHQLSNKEMAQQFNVTAITVGRWMRGEVKSIQEETASKMSKVLGFDVQAVLQGTVISMKRPILGMAKAGYDLFMDENYLGEEEVSMDEYQNGDFFLRVCGNSMIEAGILDGGLVYVQRTTCVNNREVAVVMIGDEVTIKRFYQEGKQIRLEACNPDIADRLYTEAEVAALPVKVIGRVLFSKNYM